MYATQTFPKKPIKTWRVVQNGVTVYENNFVALCQTFIQKHSLTGAKLKAVY